MEVHAYNVSTNHVNGKLFVEANLINPKPLLAVLII